MKNTFFNEIKSLDDISSYGFLGFFQFLILLSNIGKGKAFLEDDEFLHDPWKRLDAWTFCGMFYTNEVWPKEFL